MKIIEFYRTDNYPAFETIVGDVAKAKSLYVLNADTRLGTPNNIAHKEMIKYLKDAQTNLQHLIAKAEGE